MISAEDAKSTVLRLCEVGAQHGRFAIQSCELSPRGDYWIVCANSEDYVVRGMLERCYVGAGAHLINRASGCVETLGSAQSWQDHLQDKYDLEAAAGAHYVIVPGFDRTDRAALINLRQRLSLSMQDAIALLSPARLHWLTGSLRSLRRAQRLLRDKGIDTEIVLRQDALCGAVVDERVWHWEALASLMRA